MQVKAFTTIIFIIDNAITIIKYDERGNNDKQRYANGNKVPFTQN